MGIGRAGDGLRGGALQGAGTGPSAGAAIKPVTKSTGSRCGCCESLVVGGWGCTGFQLPAQFAVRAVRAVRGCSSLFVVRGKRQGSAQTLGSPQGPFSRIPNSE
jgi:hypothetical protein